MDDFQALQRQWTNWLRQPNAIKMPVNIEPRRLNIYRELFFNNVSSFVENAFPVLQQCLPEACWQQLLLDFFAEHHCQSPYFYDIAKEFLAFLPTKNLEQDYPWLIELAHFEWVELAADIADDSLPSYQAGDLLTAIPVVNPFVWPLIYQWPVHTFSQTKPNIKPTEVTCLIVVRNQFDEVNVIESNPLTAFLIEKMQMNTNLTGQQLLQQVAIETNFDSAQLLRAGADILQILSVSEVILGVKP